MANGYEGFAALGDMLAGGSRRRAEAAYDEGFQARSNSAYAMERARKERALRMIDEMKADARQLVPDAMRAYAIANGASGELGDLSAIYAQGGDFNYSQTMEGHGKAAKIEMDRQQLDALARGDLGAAQRIAAVQDDKVLPEVVDGGNAIFSPLGGFETTTLGDAEIAARNARAYASQASGQAQLGRLDIAQAQHRLERAGQWDPDGNMPRSGTTGGTYTAPSQTSIGALLGGDEGVDRERFADFQQWRAANPQYRNGEEALAAYTAATKPLGGGARVTFIDPTLPGSMTVSPPSHGGRSLESYLRADGLPPETVARIAAAAAAPVTVTTREQMLALPSGTRFRAPDGSIRVKP